MKKNNKGFVLLETLMVSTFIITVLIYLYIQFSSVEKSYYASFKYDTIQSLYSLKEVDKFINDKFGYNDFKTAVDQNENRYIELYKDNKCSVTVFPGEYSYCEKLMENLNIKTLLFVSNDISYLKIRLKTNNPYSNNLYLYLKNVDPNIANNSYILLAEFKDNTYAMLKVAEKAPKCKRATKLHVDPNADFFGSLGTKGTLASGDAFDCDVNGDGKYNSENERFYYVSDYFDTETKEFNNKYATLVYYSNVKDGAADNSKTVAYNLDGQYGENYHGPSEEILNQLPNNKIWKNIHLYKNKRMIIDDINHNSLTAYGVTYNLPRSYDYGNLSSRLLTYQEVTSACGQDNVTENSYLNNCTFLKEKTYYENSSYKLAYWLETPHSSTANIVWNIDGSRNFIYSDGTKNANYIAVRPVIEVHKDDIDY